MANEITISLSVLVSKGNLRYEFSPGQMTGDLATARRGGHVQSIGTSAEALTFGDVTAPRLAIFRNLDATNYVTLGPQNGTTSGMEAALRLAAGQAALLWLDPASTWMAQANTAAVSLQVDVFET